MYTSLTVALASLLVSATPDAPSWQSDYKSARQAAERDQKPIAVFISRGDTGYEQLGQGGKLTTAAQSLLKDKYVCLYVNLDTADGKKLAQNLEMTEKGIVISSRGGSLQAFRHEGDLSEDLMSRYLRRYSDPTRVVTTTETNPPVIEETAPVIGHTIPGTAYPAGYFPASGSSCPNCNRR
jgi:hypothetical protein